MRADASVAVLVVATLVNASDLERLTRAVVPLLPSSRPSLPGAFYPAHLSVALVDAVFDIPPRCDARAPEVFAERYCRRFKLERTRADPWRPPPSDAQETLGDLVEHYEALGADAMEEVFGARVRFPGTPLTRGAYVLWVACAIRRLRVDVLQDLAARPPRTLRKALRALPGAGRPVARRLLMYTGGDEFVLGDARVRRFVAHAINRRSVSRAQAEELVRVCAHERLLSPRYLDWRIWSLDEDAPAAAG